MKKDQKTHYITLRVIFDHAVSAVEATKYAKRSIPKIIYVPKKPGGFYYAPNIMKIARVMSR